MSDEARGGSGGDSLGYTASWRDSPKPSPRYYLNGFSTVSPSIC